MGHPDEGRIRAFLDGEAGALGPETEAHLQSCSRCADLARRQEETLSALGEALSLMDRPPAQERVRSRIPALAGTGSVDRGALAHREKDHVGVGRPASRSAGGPTVLRALVRKNLPKAASIAILLTAGAAAALPGSPIREWLFDGEPSSSEMTTVEGAHSPSGEVTGGGTSAAGPEEVGASLPVKAGGMTIRIQGLREGAEVRVRLVEGDRAGVFAGQGTRFHTEEGLMEARGAPGSVTVELPRVAGDVELRVDGVLFLRRRDGELEIPGPVKDRTPTEIRFSTEPQGTVR